MPQESTESRSATRTFLFAGAILLLCLLPAGGALAVKPVEQWGIFELALNGDSPRIGEPTVP
jgi:hypothetical protein